MPCSCNSNWDGQCSVPSGYALDDSRRSGNIQYVDSVDDRLFKTTQLNEDYYVGDTGNNRWGSSMGSKYGLVWMVSCLGIANCGNAFTDCDVNCIKDSVPFGKRIYDLLCNGDFIWKSDTFCAYGT